jgi:hypothetical protein
VKGARATEKPRSTPQVPRPADCSGHHRELYRGYEVLELSTREQPGPYSRERQRSSSGSRLSHVGDAHVIFVAGLRGELAPLSFDVSS